AILNIADRDRLFSFISSSVGKIGVLVITLNRDSKHAGTLGIHIGTGIGLDHLLNAYLHIQSADDWNVITETLRPIEIDAAAGVKVSINVFNSSFTAILIA